MKKHKLAILINVFLIALFLILTPQETVSAVYAVADNTSSALDYSGSWGTTSDTHALQGSVKYTSNEGDWVSWDFTGNRVAYLYSMAHNRGSVKVEIDDVVVDILDASVNNFQGTEVRRQVGKVYHLNSGNHTTKIINGPAGANNRRYMDLDAFVSDIQAFPAGVYDDTQTSIIINGVRYYT